MFSHPVEVDQGKTIPRLIELRHVEEKVAEIKILVKRVRSMQGRGDHSHFTRQSSLQGCKRGWVELSKTFLTIIQLLVFAELIRRGWSDADLARLAGGNLLRALRGAEATAVAMKGVTAAMDRLPPAP